MTSIIYEQPLSEHIRASLRLEGLFKHLDKIDDLPLHYSLKTILDILDVLNRTDLKSKWLQMLLASEEQLNSWMDHEGVDQSALKETIEQIKQHFDLLNRTQGKFGDDLRENLFLNQIKHGFAQAGTQTNFDIPAFHYWQSREDFKLTVKNWVNSLNPLKRLLSFLLSMLRHNDTFSPAEAKQGFFEQTLTSEKGCQLIRIKMPTDSDCYPEISAGRQRLSVRFYKPTLEAPNKTTDEEVAFEISEC